MVRSCGNLLNMQQKIIFLCHHFQVWNKMKYIWSRANEQVFFLNKIPTVFAVYPLVFIGLQAQADCKK